MKSKLLDLYEKSGFCESKNSIGNLERMLLVAEDHRFRLHCGFDILAIVRAVRNGVFYNRIEGASTIEQQLVRVVTNQYQRSFKRKIKEIFLATTIAGIIPRQSVPLIYLQIAYYGTNTFGYSKILSELNISSIKCLDLEDCAEIVSRLKYPLPNSNFSIRIKQIESRKRYLLDRFHRFSNKRLI